MAQGKEPSLSLQAKAKAKQEAVQKEFDLLLPELLKRHRKVELVHPALVCFLPSFWRLIWLYGKAWRLEARGAVEKPPKGAPARPPPMTEEELDRQAFRKELLILCSPGKEVLDLAQEAKDLKKFVDTLRVLWTPKAKAKGEEGLKELEAALSMVAHALDDQHSSIEQVAPQGPLEPAPANQVLLAVPGTDGTVGVEVQTKLQGPLEATPMKATPLTPGQRYSTTEGLPGV